MVLQERPSGVTWLVGVWSLQSVSALLSGSSISPYCGTLGELPHSVELTFPTCNSRRMATFCHSGCLNAQCVFKQILYMQVHSSPCHNCQNMERTQMSIS